MDATTASHAGTSVATASYLSACATYASYDGEMYDDALTRAPDGRYARTSAATALTHWLPLLLWLPLYGCRCEAELVSHTVRCVVWYCMPIVPLGAWLVTLATSDVDALTVVGWYDSAPFVVAVSTVGLLPWSVLLWT